MKPKIEYNFSNKLWKDKAGSWHFVSLSAKQSNEVRTNLQWQEEGWGRMKAVAKIKEHSWNTSIWFDSKSNVYVLPIKSEIRTKFKLKEGDLLEISLLL